VFLDTSAGGTIARTAQESLRRSSTTAIDGRQPTPWNQLTADYNTLRASFMLSLMGYRHWYEHPLRRGSYIFGNRDLIKVLQLHNSHIRLETTISGFASKQ